MQLKTRLIVFYASGLGSGYSPFASGTAGTAVAIPLYFLFLHWFNHPDWRLLIYAAIVAVLFVAGIAACTRLEAVLNKKDPGLAVIDEIVGYFICLALVPINWMSILAAFFLFRLFDVWKPWPIDSLQRLNGGLGIMIDDALAGVYTWILLQILFRLF